MRTGQSSNALIVGTKVTLSKQLHTHPSCVILILLLLLRIRQAQTVPMPQATFHPNQFNNDKNIKSLLYCEITHGMHDSVVTLIDKFT